MHMHRYGLIAALIVTAAPVLLAQQSKARPEDTEVWSPEPRVVTPGRTDSDAPSDAIVLFDGHDLDQWVDVKDHGPARWTVSNGLSR